jgi:hypothetical protein
MKQDGNYKPASYDAFTALACRINVTTLTVRTFFSSRQIIRLVNIIWVEKVRILFGNATYIIGLARGC